MKKQRIVTGPLGILSISLTLIVAVSFRQAGAVDLTVSALEITQAIQRPANDILLVAQRSTAVRATLVDLDGGAPIAGVTGALHVFVNGTAITPSAGIAAINAPFTVPAAPQRANENHTLNFELIAPSGIAASGDVDFRVDVTPVAGETNTANNSRSVDNLAFVNRRTPSIFFTRINYTPAAGGLPALADVQAPLGDAFVRGIYPVNDGDPNLYREGRFPTLNFTEDPDGDGRLDGNAAERDRLQKFLESCRQLIVTGGLGALNNTFLYGWIAGNPIDGNGWAPIPGFTAFGNTEPARYQRTFAHELGHDFGLDHPKRDGIEIDRMLDQVGWDVNARLVGNPPGNGVTGRVKAMALSDIMVGGRLSNQAWVDTITYNAFLNNNVLAPAAADILVSSLADDDDEFPVNSLSDRVVVVRGIFDPSGRELVELEPIFRFPWPSEATPENGEGPFVVEVIDENENFAARQFDALVGDDADTEEHGFFAVMVPVDPELEVESLRIADARTGRTLGSLDRTAPPTIRIVSPEDGAELEERTEVAWEVVDPDTPDTELQYQVAYSPNAGENFVPVAVDVEGTERTVVFNSTEIQRASGNGVIRVFVSDGLNTAFADVGNLVTLAARFPNPAAIEVPVDILPRRCPNRLLKFRARHSRTVAILGSADLDALEIDPASILVAGIAPVRGHRIKDVAAPFEPFVGKNDALDCTSEGPDGFDDLVVRFDVEAVLDRLGPVSDGDVLTVPVSAELFDGTPVGGEDVVLIVRRELDDDDDDDDDNDDDDDDDN